MSYSSYRLEMYLSPLISLNERHRSSVLCCLVPNSSSSSLCASKSNLSKLRSNHIQFKELPLHLSDHSLTQELARTPGGAYNVQVRPVPRLLVWQEVVHWVDLLLLLHHLHCYDFTLLDLHMVVDSYRTYGLMTHYVYHFSKGLLDRHIPFCTITYQALTHSDCT